MADERMTARSSATFPSTPENSVRSCRHTPASSSPPLSHTPTSRLRICPSVLFGRFGYSRFASYLNVLRIVLYSARQRERRPPAYRCPQSQLLPGLEFEAGTRAGFPCCCLRAVLPGLEFEAGTRAGFPCCCLRAVSSREMVVNKEAPQAREKLQGF